MAEENKQPEKLKEKKKIEAKPLPVDKEKTRLIEQGKIDVNAQQDGQEKKPTTPPQKEDLDNSKGGEAKDNKEVKEEPEKKEEKPKKKKEEKPIVKKEEALAYGENLPISKKQGVYISSFIKNKPIDSAINDLNSVIQMKKIVPFKGEIPHRKGKGQAGRYPIKAAGYFINLLKGLRGNVIVNGMELEKTRIATASASWARRPMRSGGRQGKRTNVILRAKEITGGKK